MFSVLTKYVSGFLFVCVNWLTNLNLIPNTIPCFLVRIILLLVTWTLQPIVSVWRQSSHNFYLMRQNRHYQIFWLMCNWVGGFGFGLDIGVCHSKFSDTDWIWSLRKNFGSNPIPKFPNPFTTFVCCANLIFWARSPILFCKFPNADPVRYQPEMSIGPDVPESLFQTPLHSL